MAKKKTKAYPQEIYRKIEGFRLFDDTFMSKVFDGQKEYHIDRTIGETGELFGDMAHIVYVNGENDDDTALGKLMHDFRCTKAEEMHYPLLARRVRFFKETQKGQETMCAAVEEYANEVATEREKRLVRQSIIKGFRSGGLTKRTAAAMFPKLKSAEIDALYQEAKKPARGRRPVAR